MPISFSTMWVSLLISSTMLARALDCLPVVVCGIYFFFILWIPPSILSWLRSCDLCSFISLFRLLFWESKQLWDLRRFEKSYAEMWSGDLSWVMLSFTFEALMMRTSWLRWESSAFFWRSLSSSNCFFQSFSSCLFFFFRMLSFTSLSTVVFSTF